MAQLHHLGAAVATRGQTNTSGSQSGGKFLAFHISRAFCMQQCWSCWDRVLGLSMQLVRGMGSRHLLLVRAGEVCDGGVAGVLHPLLLHSVFPLGRRGGTLCPGRGGPALLKKMNSYLEKHLDLTIKLYHVSSCSPLFEAGTRKCGNLFALLGL